MTAWAEVKPDLRRALLRAGRCETAVDTMLREMERVYAAVERARGAVEAELLWALVAMQADRARRANE